MNRKYDTKSHTYADSRDRTDPAQMDLFDRVPKPKESKQSKS